MPVGEPSTRERRRKEKTGYSPRQRDLAPSREKAQALILAGKVRLEGQSAKKAGQLVRADAHIEVEAPPKYVSRAGVKLEAGLTEFHVPVEGKVCMDVGTSTGGLPDCLLQNGASACSRCRYRSRPDCLAAAERVACRSTRALATPGIWCSKR